jgi:hypothetical protein
MKCGFAVAGAALLLVACNPTDPCRSHTDEASCVADKACQWKAEKNKCKTVKKEKAGKKENESPHSETTSAPPPSEQAAPSTGVDNNSLPSTEHQPQPTYPE